MQRSPCKNVAMPSIDEEAKRWQLETAARVGRAVQKRREVLGWSAAELSRRTAELQYPISRVAISKIESNSRLGKLDLAELLVLAAALKTSPIALVFPGPYMDLVHGEHSFVLRVEALPGEDIAIARALDWFCADQYWQDRDDAAVSTPDEDDWVEATRTTRIMRRITELIGLRESLARSTEPDHKQIAFYDNEIRRCFTDLERLQRKDNA